MTLQRVLNSALSDRDLWETYRDSDVVTKRKVVEYISDESVLSHIVCTDELDESTLRAALEKIQTPQTLYWLTTTHCPVKYLVLSKLASYPDLLERIVSDSAGLPVVRIYAISLIEDQKILSRIYFSTSGNYSLQFACIEKFDESNLSLLLANTESESLRELITHRLKMYDASLRRG